MSGADFSLVSPGEEFVPRADVWNELLRMRNWWRSAQLTGGLSIDKAGSRSNPSVVWIENNSGSDCPRYGVLSADSEPSSIPIDPDQNEPGFLDTLVLSGVMPQTIDDVLAYVVTLEPIAAGCIGRAAIAGAVQTQIQVTGKTDGLLAAGLLNADNTQLQLMAGGYRVLWIQEYDAGEDGSTGNIGLGGDGSGTAQTLWGVVQLGWQEGLLSAQMYKTQDGTHPVGQTRLYTLMSPPYGTPNPVVVPVLNEMVSVQPNALVLTAYVQGINGQYKLVAINPCS